MDLTHVAKLGAIDADGSTASGVIGGIGANGSIACLGQAQSVQNGIQLALQREEGFAGTVGAQNKHFGLFGELLAFYGQIYLGDLVELCCLVVVRIVSAQNIQHGGHSNGAHDGSIFAQRILNLERFAQRRFGRKSDLIENGGRNEGVCDDLTVAQAAAKCAGFVFHKHEGAVSTLSRGLEGRSGDGIVAVGTTNFFRDIGHQIQVGTERGNKNGVAIHFNLQQVQVLDHIFFADVGTKKLIDLFGLQGQGLSLRNIVDDINDAIQHIAAFQHFNKLAGTLNCRHGHHGIQILFEFTGSIGTHTQSKGGLTNGGAIEIGGFEYNSGGILNDFGVFTTHDTGKADGARIISNHQHTALQVANITVQRGQLFAFLSLADNDLAGGNITVIKRVHGLAILQHDIVGDVNDIVNGTYAVGTQSLTHPLGRGADLDIGNHTGSVAVAQFRGGNFHIQFVKDGTCIAALYHRLVMLHLHAKSSGRLTGQTDDGVAVGAVVCDLKFHDGIAVADHIVDIVTGFACLIVEDPNSVGENTGQIVLGQTQLSKGTQHAVGLFSAKLALGDVYTAGKPGIMQCGGDQIAFMYVLGTGDDLYRFFFAYIYLADPHMIGILMADDGNNATNLDIFDLGIHAFVGFDLLTKDSKSFHIFFVGDMGQIHELLIDPISVEIHILSLLRIDSGIERRYRRSNADH